MSLKGQDVLVALKLAVAPERMSYADLGKSVGLSASQAFSAVQRASRSGLLVGSPKRANTEALLEFLIHGVKYAFPAVRGALKRGIPTAHSASPLRELMVASDVPTVWPDASGDTRGETINPIYKSVPVAAKGDPRLHAVLALVDAIRAGRIRERELAANLLREILQHVETTGSEPGTFVEGSHLLGGIPE